MSRETTVCYCIISTCTKHFFATIDLLPESVLLLSQFVAFSRLGGKAID